jgi:hypothetical protein
MIVCVIVYGRMCSNMVRYDCDVFLNGRICSNMFVYVILYDRMCSNMVRYDRVCDPKWSLFKYGQI